METVLKPREIAERVSKVILKSEIMWDGRMKQFRGRLESGRPATVTAREDGEMVRLTALVPGGGGLTFGFQLFADDATEERVERYIKHYASKHAEAVTEWQNQPEVIKWNAEHPNGF